VALIPAKPLQLDFENAGYIQLPCFISWNAPTSDISGVRSNPNKVFPLAYSSL
jgi:hypothetical protein